MRQGCFENRLGANAVETSKPVSFLRETGFAFCHRAAGFSLIELTMVLILAGILAAIVTPRWFENDISLDAVAGQLQNDVRLAQNLAMSRGQRHRIAFDTALNRYGFTDAAGVAVNHPLTNTATVALPAGVVFSANNFSSGYLAYDGLGRPYDGATALTADTTVELSRGGVTRTLTVTRNTGFVASAP